MLERTRVLSYIFSAAAVTVVLLALKLPHKASAEPRAEWVRVDVVPSYEHGR
jgi:hypothetical protein